MEDLLRSDLPQPSQFINDLLARLAHHTTTTTPNPEDDENDNGNQARHQSRQIRSQPTSAFPSSQLMQLKPLMLTLHCIFPNEFLLALDILDRGLVRRVLKQNNTSFVQAGGEIDVEARSEAESRTGSRSKNKPEEDFFFVTSASTTSTTSVPMQQQGNQHQQQTWQQKGYEVRLQAWNCTCPSFTISAFRDLGPQHSSPPPETQNQIQDTDDDDSISDYDCDHDHDHADGVAADADGAHAYSFGGTLPLHPESAPPVCKHILACLLAAVCPGLGGEKILREGGEEGGESFVTLGREEIAALCAGWGG